MNLQGFDNKGLSLLWLATGNDNPLKAAIEDELQIRIQTSTNFSREWFFNLLFSGMKAFGVSFIPTSDSYKIYGHHRTLSFLFSDEEAEVCLNNIRQNPPVITNGNVRAKILVEDVPDDIMERMKEVGFNTTDVLEVLQ
jgi:hypothetical protein